MKNLFALLFFALAASTFSQTPPLPSAGTLTFRTNDMHLEVFPVTNGWVTVRIVTHPEQRVGTSPMTNSMEPVIFHPGSKALPARLQRVEISNSELPTPVITDIKKLDTGWVDVRWNGFLPAIRGVHYEIHRRDESQIDGDSGWHRVGCVDSGQIQFIDYEPTTVQAFYRVRSVAKDGKSKWSEPYPF